MGCRKCGNTRCQEMHHDMQQAFELREEAHADGIGVETKAERLVGLLFALSIT